MTGMKNLALSALTFAAVLAAPSAHALTLSEEQAAALTRAETYLNGLGNLQARFLQVNPDGSVAVVVMNPTEEKIGYRLYVGGQAVEAESLPHSIATLIY